MFNLPPTFTDLLHNKSDLMQLKNCSKEDLGKLTEEMEMLEQGSWVTFSSFTRIGVPV